MVSHDRAPTGKWNLLEPISQEGSDTTQICELPPRVELAGEDGHIATLLFGGLNDLVDVGVPLAVALSVLLGQWSRAAEIESSNEAV